MTKNEPDETGCLVVIPVFFMLALVLYTAWSAGKWKESTEARISALESKLTSHTE